jgi:beta-lactamase class D
LNRFIYILTSSLLLATFTLSACASAATPITQTPIPTLAPRVPEETREPTPTPDLAPFFDGRPGAFVRYDLSRDRYIRYNPSRCAERFLPASTFKLLNSLIGLETGVIPDENYLIPWDGTHYDVPAWNQDHTMKSAIQNSVVWYYQELARRVGTQKMQAYVDAAGYGNQDISGRIDSFWLDGGLRISADEQVAFLKRLYQNELPFSQRSMDIVKSIIVMDQTPSYTISGKTGSAQTLELQTGWFVGYLETGVDVYFFATNLESTGPDGIANGTEAKKITTQILQALGHMIWEY